MSEPKNHHYVSRCHIDNFFNKKEQTIYLYDKVRDNFYSSTSSKNIFSEDYSNSRFKNGIIDHKELERDLQVNFEDHFFKITSLITDFNTNIISRNEETILALYRLTLYGLIGDLRNPTYKINSAKHLNQPFEEIMQYAEEDLVKSYNKYIAEISLTKHPNHLDYFATALKFLEKMGDLDFKIFEIQSNDVFLLPDTSSISFRAKINTYFNPDIYEKAIVGIPLTDKIFIHAESKKLKNTSNQHIKIKADGKEVVKLINKDIFNQAYKTVATSDKDKLTKIIADLKGSA